MLVMLFIFLEQGVVGFLLVGYFVLIVLSLFDLSDVDKSKAKEMRIAVPAG